MNFPEYFARNPGNEPSKTQRKKSNIFPERLIIQWREITSTDRREKLCTNQEI